MKFKDLFNWRTDRYPSYYTEYPQEDQLETTYEMSNLLAQWYLDSFEIKIPEYQYTGEDFDFSTRWSGASMDYSTNFLLPVVQQLLATSKASAKHPASLRLEDSCVTWGGQFEGNELVNTCPVDNFITLLNLHSHKVSSALRLANVSPSQRLQTMLSHITSREFDELRNWLAPQLGVRLVNFRFDFLCYEGAMVQLLINLSICSDRYEVIFQCWSCSYQLEKKFNLIYVLTFKENSQKTIDFQIKTAFSCLKCRDPNAKLESLIQKFVQVTPLIILEVGHVNNVSPIRETDIENQININTTKINYITPYSDILYLVAFISQ